MELASSYASEIDFVILLITVLVGFWFFLSEGVLFYLLWKFRERPGVPSQYITGKEHKYTKWLHRSHVVILLCDIAIVGFAVNVWYNVKQVLPENPDGVIRIISQQWTWKFVHPGPDGVLDTPDDIVTVDELHVEKDKTYNYELTSLDVLHDFSVPVFRLKQDAVPGRTIMGWFQPTKLGTYDIQCAEICGIGHGVMGAVLHIEDAAVHAAWMAKESPVGTNSSEETRVAALAPRQ